MADIIPFPLDRRVTLVRKLADRIEMLHGPAANAYWREHVATIAAELRDIGVSLDAVRTEVVCLQEAVQIYIRDRAVMRQG